MIEALQALYVRENLLDRLRRKARALAFVAGRARRTRAAQRQPHADTCRFLEQHRRRIECHAGTIQIVVVRYRAAA